MNLLRFVRNCGKLRLIALLIVLAAAVRVQAADVSSRLAEILVPSNKTTFGGKVVALRTGDVLFEYHANTPMIPASNQKLVVLAAAIDQLGGDYQYTTVLAIRDHDLVVIGSGDPVFGDERLSKRDDVAITHVFETWAARLKELGIEQIPGDVIIDDSIFDKSFVHESWPKNQYQKWYEAPIGGLNFNANCVTATVRPTKAGQPARIGLIPPNKYVGITNETKSSDQSSVIVLRPRHSDDLILRGKVNRYGELAPVTVRDPGLFFGAALKEHLIGSGIPVGGNVKRETVRLKQGLLPTDVHIVAVHRQGLPDVLMRAGRDSLGMVAEGVFKTLGVKHAGQGTWSSAASALNAYFRKLGIPAKQVSVDDGSGLSRKNRLSPAASVRILQHMYADPAKFNLLSGSLAVSGADVGTLRKRMRDKAVRARVFGKTGTIAGVRTLAGYIKTDSGDWLAFAFFYNTVTGKSPKPRMDDACRFLVDWRDPSQDVMRTANNGATDGD